MRLRCENICRRRLLPRFLYVWAFPGACKYELSITLTTRWENYLKHDHQEIQCGYPESEGSVGTGRFPVRKLSLFRIVARGGGRAANRFAPRQCAEVVAPRQIKRSKRYFAFFRHWRFSRDQRAGRRQALPRLGQPFGVLDHGLPRQRPVP